MRNLHLYFAILFGVKLILLASFGYWAWRRRSKLRHSGITQSGYALQPFYCVRSQLKQMNDGFYIGQIVFTNNKHCRLPAHLEIPGKSSEEQ
ncbi:MAG: hypothetical protein AB1898_21550 [Acidobacteriota bacterium]